MKVLNKRKLHVCRQGEDTKAAGDIQRRILHGIIAVNPFISILCPDINHECLFASRGRPFFLLSHTASDLLLPAYRLFCCFNEWFPVKTFSYTEKTSAMSAGHLQERSRESEAEEAGSCNVVMLTTAIRKSRILVDFLLY